MITLMIRRPPIATPFPYTTLFRSCVLQHRAQNFQSLGVTAGFVNLLGKSGCARSQRYASAVGTWIFGGETDRKSTRLNSSHPSISYAVFWLKKKKLIIFQLIH